MNSKSIQLITTIIFAFALLLLLPLTLMSIARAAEVDVGPKLSQPIQTQIAAQQIETVTLAITGENTGDQYGESAASAGDVNNDGYADVIVNAFGYTDPDSAESGHGKVYVYLGSSTGLSTTPVFTAIGETTEASLGRGAVGSAGDINKDGYGDIIIGAHGTNGHQGRVYIYYGNATGITSTVVFSVSGENTGDEFARSAASAGDVNNDTYVDIIVGASGYMTNKGKIYVYYGSASGLSSTPDFTATGVLTEFGRSVASAGDVDNDGYDDVIVGEPDMTHGDAGPTSGRVYLYYGSASGLSSTNVVTLSGENAGDKFGEAAASAGDINNDGYDDVIVGARGYTDAQAEQGKMYVYHGSGSGLNATPAFSFTEVNIGGEIGSYVAPAGDVNKDGYDDVLVGSRSFDAGGGNKQGMAYLYYGSSTGLSSSSIVTAAGESASDAFSFSVNSTGDVNGDGSLDIVIGAPDYNSGSQQGKVYLYYGDSFVYSTQNLPDTGQTTSYTTTFGEDSDYSINPPSYTANGDAVTDHVTGLIWQQNEVLTTTGVATATTYCNNLSLEGYSDWRLPTSHELYSLVNLSRSSPPLSSTYFFADVSADYWWSITQQADGQSNYWAMNSGGGIGPKPETEAQTHDYYVRCVRDDLAVTITPTFTDNGDETVTESSTSLMWQRSGTLSMTWETALSQCENLTLASYTDWRLPNIKELRSLSNDDILYSPSISTTYFTITTTYAQTPTVYWSSTTRENATTQAWYTDFYYGLVSHEYKTDNGYVLCTRSLTTEADLSIVKSVTSSSAEPGETITYTLKFSNTGSAIASGVVITDEMPAEVLTITQVISSADVLITQTLGLTYQWTVGDLSPGEGGAITITGQLSNTLSEGTIFTNTATITTTLVDSNTSNNTAKVAVTVSSSTSNIYLPIIVKNN